MSAAPLPTSVDTMRRVSQRLVVPRLVTALVWTAIVLGALWWAYARWGGAWLVMFGVAAAFGVWNLVLVPLRVRGIGYLETDSELLISKGKMWRTVTAIPYGRIQFVDVKSGPISRALSLKTIVIHTASSTSDSTLPGLPAAEADALRDRLAVQARERMSGL